MAEILQAASFLTVLPPRESIIDYSEHLSIAGKQNLESKCRLLGFRTKIVILPSDYSPGLGASFLLFCRGLASSWQLSGNRFLLVIDLKGRQAIGLSGEGLKKEGIGSRFIYTEALNGHFKSHMRNGNVQEAISSALSTIDSKLALSATIRSRQDLHQQRDMALVAGLILFALIPLTLAPSAAAAAALA